MSSLPHPRTALVLALLGLLCLPAVAAADAVLVASEPPQGGTISTPYTIRATFDQPVDAGRSRIVVRDASGTEVARGGVAADDPATLVADLPALAPGAYLARWTVVSADGHVLRGDIEFTVVAPVSPTPTSAPTTAGPTTSAGPNATASPWPTAAPTASQSPSPTPDDGDQPTAGTADLLIALLLAGAAVAGLLFYLWRRRAA